ncbi:MAG: FlgD immunoglobulin-like domain containing protein [Candidatus Eisenbacteria bacterium]
MRRILVPAALLLLACAPAAHAAIQFQGHLPTATSCRVWLDWSSDYGGDWIASRPISALSSGLDLLADTSRVLSYGALSGSTHVTIAPAGPVSFATGPVLTVRTSGSANSNGVAGHTVQLSHSACLQFVAPGAGNTVHWAVRWRRSVTGSANAQRSTDLRGPAGAIVTGPGTFGADSGMVFGTAPGTTTTLCGFLLDQAWTLWAGSAAYSAGTLDMEVFLDSAPPPLDAGDAVPMPPALELAPPRPSPSRGAATFEYALPVAGDVTLEVLDVGGRVVARHAAGPRPAGRHVLQWDAADDAGERLRAGVYFARLALRDATGATRFASRRVVVTR